MAPEVPWHFKHNLQQQTCLVNHKRCDAEMQKVLKLFVDKHGHQIVNGSLVGRVQGFTSCLQSIYEGLPQQVVFDMADAVRPMALPWVLMAPTNSLLQ